MHRPEILAPGGSFAAAFHAIEAGADGIYLGLREFSARKAAVNFDLDQLRRIRGLAADRGRRIYVALNTVVRDDETGRLAESLAMLEALRVDGVIVQDLGAAALARRYFPGLELHASTQMAVHNAAGLAEIHRMGIRRAILARELTLEEIAALRRACPDVDLEVFVHGALCYSFSGICLASWGLTGRSGNRGDCAQICRGRFTLEEGGRGTTAGTFFSCRDLFLGRDALELARLGVRALKIEGRMKSPEYAAAVVRLYRAVIDRGDALDDAEYARLARAAQTAFAREPTTGWLRSSSGTRLVDTRFPGHRGARLGVVAPRSREEGRDPDRMPLHPRGRPLAARRARRHVRATVRSSTRSPCRRSAWAGPRACASPGPERPWRSGCRPTCPPRKPARKYGTSPPGSRTFRSPARDRSRRTGRRSRSRRSSPAPRAAARRSRSRPIDPSRLAWKRPSRSSTPRGRARSPAFSGRSSRSPATPSSRRRRPCSTTAPGSPTTASSSRLPS